VGVHVIKPAHTLVTTSQGCVKATFTCTGWFQLPSDANKH